MIRGHRILHPISTTLTDVTGARAERRLLRYLDECEALERQAFAARYVRENGAMLSHVAAAATMLRYGPSPACLE